jgi:hypothetical protein
VTTLETVGGIDFGRRPVCRLRMSAERAKGGEWCFVCATYGPPARRRAGVILVIAALLGERQRRGGLR